VAKFFVTMPSMDKQEIGLACSAVLAAATGSKLKMDAAYVDMDKSRALCFWDAPDRKSIEELFAKAGLKPKRIHEVMPYPG
jgi:hypothetical protein